MASILSPAPRGTFAHHARQLRRASSLVPSTPGAQLSLFKAPANVISPWRQQTGAQEWQTSAYHYNPATTKTLPTASYVTDDLLRAYATSITSRGLASTGSSSTARSAVALRRKRWERMYISGSTVKDYGDRMVVRAFMYDAEAAEQEERTRRLAEFKARGRGKGGAAGGRRRGPGGAGGPAGARRPSRFGVAGGAGFAARVPSRMGGARPPTRSSGATTGIAPRSSPRTGGTGLGARGPPRTGGANGSAAGDNGLVYKTFSFGGAQKPTG
ncbi:hypothetical protein LTR53_007607, partial [Teratosphaeriaceae sp. CCFEE 6253]